MNTLQKVAVLLIGVAFVTTVSLPKRQFAQAATAVFDGGSKLLATAMGTRNG